MLRFLLLTLTVCRSLSNLNLAETQCVSRKLELYNWQEVSMWLTLGRICRQLRSLANPYSSPRS